MDYFSTTTTATLTVSPLSNSCFHLPDAEFDKIEQRRTSNLLTGIINAVISPFAVTANFLIVFVILRKYSLQTPSNLLLTCLAISDLLVGLIVQPSFVIFRILENTYGFVPCVVRMIYWIGFFICYGVSFMTLCAISCERLLTLLYSFRFQELVRRERVSKTAVFIWLVNLLFTCLQWANNHIFVGIHLCLWLASLVIAVLAQCKILLISLRHQRQIKRHNPGTSSPRQMQIKLAINLTSIVAIYFALNLPVLIVTKVHQIIFGYIENYNYYSWAETAAFLNSSVNPLVCTWRVKEIRKAIRYIFVKKRKRRRGKRTTLGNVSENNNVFLVRFRETTVL